MKGNLYYAILKLLSYEFMIIKLFIYFYFLKKSFYYIKYLLAICISLSVLFIMANQVKVLGCSQCSLGACCQGPYKICDATGAGCMDAPRPQPYIPPPIIIPATGILTPPPTVPPRVDPNPQEDYCPCGKDGIGNCNWSCGVSVPDCYDKFAPVWLRVVSNEGPTGTIAWKTNEPVRVVKNRFTLNELWSIAPSAGGGLDASGNFKQYKPFYSDPTIKTFDTTKNKIDPWTMKFFALNDNVVHETKSWSNHFCGKGLPSNPDASGKYLQDEKCALNTKSCSAGATSPCRKWCKDDFDGCVGWPLEVNGVQTWHGEDMLSFTAPAEPDDKSSTTRYGDHGVLNDLLKFADPIHWADLRYDEYWSMSFWARYAKRMPSNSKACSEERVSFEFTPPAGYACKDVKFYRKKDGSYADRSIDVTFKNLAADPKKCQFDFVADGRGNLVVLEVERDDSCTVNASPNVQCSYDGKQATVNWSAPANNGITPDRIVNRLNKEPFNDWYNNTEDQFIALPSTATTSTFNVQPGALYNYEISYDKQTGTNVFEKKCQSQTVSFVCDLPRADICSSSSLIVHNLGSDLSITSKAKQLVKNMVHVFLNADNLDSAGNPKPVCIPSSDPSNPGYDVGCPAGSEQLRYYYDKGTNPTDTFDITYKYNQIFISDLNNSNKLVDKLIIKAYFADPSINNGEYSADNPACNITMDKFAEPVVSPTCSNPAPESNTDSTSCSDVKRPLIQKKATDILTIQNEMRGIDPTTQIKFDWVDSVPQGSSECSALYTMSIWEVDSNDSVVGDPVVSYFVDKSEFTLDANRLDFGKSYRWKIKAMVTQANMCSMLDTNSYEYNFTTNAFPEYLKGGVSFDRAIVGKDTAVVPGVNVSQSKCDGNVNCTNVVANTSGTWGGAACFSGNPKYNDSQAPTGTKRVVDNPITYWFDYNDPENYAGATCVQNEMMMHRLAIVKKSDIAKLGTNPNATQDSIIEIKDKINNGTVDGLLVEFDVSDQTLEKSSTFNSSKANIKATRYLDVLNRMRVVYEIEFLEGMNTNQYEVFASMVGTALDPRGAAVRTSILMYDIPYDWDIKGSSNVAGNVNAISCTGGTNDPNDPSDDDDDDNECTCPGACCDRFEDDPSDDEPELQITGTIIPIPNTTTQPNPAPTKKPTPKPVPNPTKKPTPKPGGGTGCGGSPGAGCGG